MLLDSGVTVKADGQRLRRRRPLPRGRPPREAPDQPEGEAVDGDLPSVEGLVESSLYLGTSTQMLVRLPDEVVMTVLCPNTDEAERRACPAAGRR